MLSQGPRNKQCRNKGHSEEYIKIFQNCLKIISTEKKGNKKKKVRQKERGGESKREHVNRRYVLAHSALQYLRHNEGRKEATGDKGKQRRKEERP